MSLCFTLDNIWTPSMRSRLCVRLHLFAATPLTETIHYHHLQPVEMPRMGGKLTTKQIYKISSLRPTCPLFKVLMKLTFFCKVVYIRYPAGISGKKHCNEHVMNSNKRTPTLATSTQLLTIFPQVSQMYAMPGKRFTQAFRGSRGIFSVPAG